MSRKFVYYNASFNFLTGYPDWDLNNIDGAIFLSALENDISVNWSDDTKLVGSFSSSIKWIGGVLAPNGKIYCVPYSSTQILVIDPSDNSTELIGSFGGSDKWNGGVLAPNGKIYCVPLNTNQILVIDPSDNSTELIGSFGGSDK